MARRDLSTRDASAYAQSALDIVLDAEKVATAPRVAQQTVEEAMYGAGVLEYTSTRDVTRVLFISRDTELLNPTTQTLDGFLNLSDLFEEVHVLILRQGIETTHPVLRVAPNVWLYTATAKNWWWTPVRGLDLLHRQLSFASGFRPDLIVARDPFECGLVARIAGRKYQRPTQLHVLEDYTTKEFTDANRHNTWRRWMPKYLVPKFPSVRTATMALQDLLEKRFTIPVIDTLPRFHNYTSHITAPLTVDLKTIYQPFVFIMLFVGTLSHQSTLYRAIDAARFALRNPRVGLVVVGDGPTRSEFEKRAKILEIDRQVVFERRAVDVNAYLKSANVLIVTDTDEDSEDVVLRGAAAGVPMVLAETPQRHDLFPHGEAAFLCPPTDVQAFTDRINDLLNDISLRGQFTRATQALMSAKFHEDPEIYRQAYRASIEQALFVEADQKDADE